MQVYKMTGISVWYIGNLSQLEVVILVHQRLFLFHFVGFTTKRHEIRFDIGWKSICWATRLLQRWLCLYSCASKISLCFGGNGYVLHCSLCELLFLSVFSSFLLIIVNIIPWLWLSTLSCCDTTTQSLIVRPTCKTSNWKKNLEVLVLLIRLLSWSFTLSDFVSLFLKHLKEEMRLGYLAQELIAIDRLSPESWYPS